MFSQSISQRTPNSSSSLSGALFRDRDGHELSFFVQVDLNNRSRTVSTIKASLLLHAASARESDPRRKRNMRCPLQNVWKGIMVKKAEEIQRYRKSRFRP
ncbi:hypothetical protein C0993_002407 [Termitomyces sp. T159_Od127]|nr:hypothetical protein C0993_002407 [Termitomyces sp. T159_Od127]